MLILCILATFLFLNQLKELCCLNKWPVYANNNRLLSDVTDSVLVENYHEVIEC